MEEKEIVEYCSDYKIIGAKSVEELVKKVKTQLHKKDNEFEPLGAPFVGPTDQDGNVIYQAMTAFDEDEV